ncbi:hypothetical protein EG328_010155 [Venturia inaequalis]|uniref:Prolyl 4-hydroxylase alpha subunit domain-containing protein n=1 Tax=Venturia inaequalis TaxID=5025 RepID=A0A8H3U7F6_VENIN|nr:hypothetical protein EG328_010155 [Venturia inaequalis]KAE9970104.1 hypothetical protein EG327_010378 [Venturia inaequalis]
MATPALPKPKTSFPTILSLSCLLGVLALFARQYFETLPQRFPSISHAIPSGISSYLSSRATNSTEEDHEYLCPKSNATIKIFSSYPLIIYIENFISESEREHLKNVANPLFKRSEVATEGLIDEIRTSSSAILPRDDPIVDCITRRAAEFQGHVSPLRMEPLQVVRYQPGEKYDAHYDWDDGDVSGSLRTTTFFAYVGCEGCEGGSTKFYSIARKAMSRQWCRVIDCGATGVEFLPIPGAAIYWENVNDKGEGREDTLHSGMPLIKGVKYGLNIWTRAKNVD